MKAAGETGYYTSVQYKTQTTTNGWVTLSGFYDVPGNIKTLNLRIDNNGGGTIWYDDLVLRRTNAPASEIVEESSYYPFGMKQEGYNNIVQTTRNLPAQRYKYQGQERNDELGLNWDSFKWRNYDFALGRFMSIDPLAEDYPYNSTYAFQENKMGMGRELEGLELVEINDDISHTMSEMKEDVKKAAKAFGNWFSETFSEGKLERSSKDVSVSLRSKNGGGNNPTTTGAADEHWNVDGFIDTAPGKQKDGNNLKKLKDFVALGKDINSGTKLGGKISGMVKAEVNKKDDANNIDTTFTVTRKLDKDNNFINFVKGSKKADSIMKRYPNSTKEIESIR